MSICCLASAWGAAPKRELHSEVEVRSAGEDSEESDGSCPEHHLEPFMNQGRSYGDEASECEGLKDCTEAFGCKNGNHSVVASCKENVYVDSYNRLMEEWMNTMPMLSSGDPNLDFAMMMTVHHQGAINFSKLLLKCGNDCELLNLARNIISAQQKEIAQLNGWLDENTPDHSDC
ncbi:MAG: DUF305 domain-containing protein [Bacteroidia bacterium]